MVTPLEGDIASGKVEDFRIFFCEKEKVPCCRRRIRLPSGETSGLHVNRVTGVI